MDPGDDEKHDIEGDNVDECKFGKYKCVYRESSDSLFIMIKDTKTKRSFTNSFSKATLKKMEWKGSIQKMISFLKDAQKGEKHDLSFKIAFGESAQESQNGQVIVTENGSDGSNETEATRVISFGSMSTSYVKGYAMYILAAIETSYLGAEYVFELFEQERKEWDILRDVIADMQEEIDELKEQMAAQAETFEQQKAELILWSNAVYNSNDTGLVSEVANTTVAEMVLPQKAGKYLVSCSFEAYTNAQQWWIYYYFKLGNRTLNTGGQYLHQNHGGPTYGFPVSLSFAVTLNGNETEQQRKLVLVHHPHSSYPSGMRRCCIHGFELSCQ